MTLLSWKPTGRRLFHWPNLKDGQRVEGYFGYGSYRTNIRHGWISRKVEDYDRSSITTIYVNFPYLGRSVTRETLCSKWSFKDRWSHGSGSFELYSINLIKENMTMANKLLGLIKLNKNQRKLQKIGIYDENGNLTLDGQEVLLNLIAKDYEEKIVELTKDWKSDDDKKKD